MGRRVEKMTTMAIAPHNLTKEGRDLERAGKDKYDSVVLINPHKTWIGLEYDKEFGVGFDGQLVPKPVVFDDGEGITNIDAFVVRGSSKYGGALSALSSIFFMTGCSTLDPPSRFSAGYSSKLKTTIRRYSLGIGSETYISYYLDGANEMITRIRKTGRLPVIVKPIDGKRSRGRIVVKTAKRLRKIAKEFFESRTNEKIPFYVQPFENILNEYRVLLVDGEVIAVVEKIKSVATATGSSFVVPQNDIKDVKSFAHGYCSMIGVVGADIAITDNGFIMIEENRAPQWRRLQEITGIDIAAKIVDRILERKVMLME